MKRLFAVSGNRCAFPACNEPVVDEQSGVVVGRICHIAGRKPMSARYDAAQSDEERHGFDNLVLMCPTHHVVIDDARPDEFPVERLHEIKRAHEDAVDPVEEPTDALVDELFRTSASQARTLNRLSEVLDFTFENEEDHQQVLEEINVLLPRLVRLPRRSREFFVAILRRATDENLKMSVLWPEIENALNLDRNAMTEEIAILDDHGFVSVEIDHRGVPLISVSPGSPDWHIWETLREFSDASGIPLSDLVVNLNFDYLD